MNKTKLGIPTGVMGAVIYFAALFGGYIPLFICAGYVLIKEENNWLRKNAFRAVFLMLLFSGMDMLVSSVNEILSIFGNIFDTYIEIPINFDDILLSVITLTKTAVFVIFGVMALSRKHVSADKAVDNKK
ncbi:hypothetical protein [Porcipelethomonas sp.]|uniref:hypothetical protein n=1 Tax=Porcipelethomonas sp. TaxID=2981675 RepID=UPI003EF2D3D3